MILPTVYLDDLVHPCKVHADATDRMLSEVSEVVESNPVKLSPLVCCLTAMKWPSRLVPPE